MAIWVQGNGDKGEMTASAIKIEVAVDEVFIGEGSGGEGSGNALWQSWCQDISLVNADIFASSVQEGFLHVTE